MGQIKRKKSYGIIDFPDPNNVESVKRYCPNCSSLLQKWAVDFQHYDKPITVPDTLFCLQCGETVKLYHPSSLV